MAEPILTSAELQFLSTAREAVLATVDAGGLPRLVPCCFSVLEHGDVMTPLVLHTPIDHKPKRSEDPHALARVRDILRRPEVVLLVDRWAEDWSRLGWLRLRGRAELLEPDDPAVGEERVRVIGALRAKYAQYASHALEARPLIRISVASASRWGDLRA
jgi:PPOX class probable F420-dependent enzyme